MLSMVWYFGCIVNDKYFFPSNDVREKTSFDTFRKNFLKQESFRNLTLLTFDVKRIKSSICRFLEYWR